jgi:hypothetical protein
MSLRNEPEHNLNPNTTIQFLGKEKTIYRINNSNFRYASDVFSMFDDNKIDTCNDAGSVINTLRNIDILNPHFRMNIEVHTLKSACTEYSIFMLACESANLNLIWTLLPNNLNNLNKDYIETGCGFLTTPFEVIIGKLPFIQGHNIIAYAALNGICPTRPVNLSDLHAYKDPFLHVEFNL